ncbi:MAG: HupE/UreJ family protein [Hoeflea sp.]|uniref:HupE/UreJ family protein n=1 Tax=Hoeflea sp. TaxID=1940281 RepID=UPI001DC1C12C|nr:HupE/UreJ family protein [Hoeflea sp.]MBU4528425.1 HupE/UreJ family protein [Alphaproteobacteria bacterium]MBU4543094.1 HupE/UreJ family protein [Alphaproteobacteria bacterium]MBU4551785.1 HupE/UreJ family protein [Alphaproteobacteria bacterium]MBV1723680.1 HupE/UreJ family protein [Hoeflea sp.]MBV1761996.1 HupE/UreJ family protein [Hoeflea sp.]
MALLLVATSAASIRAHEIRPAIVDLTFPGDGTVRLDMSLILEAALSEIGVEHADTDDSPNAQRYDELRLLDEAGLAAEFDRFEVRFLEGVRLVAGQESIPLAVVEAGFEPVGDTDFARLSRITLVGPLPPGATEVSYSFDPAFGPSVVRVPDTEGAYSYSVYLDDGSPSAPIPVEGGLTLSAGQVFIDYIGIGFTHIVPKGLDHILFVVGLFLLSPRLKPLLIQITAFTVAHSVTLALAMLGVISLPASIVEPMIALSIVYIAIENLATNRLSPWRPFVVFGFGLLHGLGFAGVLTEFGLTPTHFVSGLIGFNVGVEAGQLAVVAACYALFGAWFSDKSWYRARITMPMSLAIGCLALWWVVERTGLAA